MEEAFTFSYRPLEIYNGSLHPYILGIMKWNNSEYITPTTLRYFKKPEKRDYPLVLGTKHNKLHQLTLQKEQLPVFLSQENIKTALVYRKLKDITVWTNRGTLARILMGAFYKNNWRMFATKIGSNIYLTCERYVFMNKWSKHHWKFVQNCFTENVGEKPNTKLPMNEDEQFYCLFHAKIANFNLIYTDEITGVLADSDVKNMYDRNELNQLKFVLIKTMHDGKTQYDWSYQYKLWWTQAHLVKVNDIFVGIKESDNVGPLLIRQEIEHYKVYNLCHMGRWKKNRQLGELFGFLKWLQTKMSNIDCPYTTCELNFNSASKNVTFTVHEGKTEYSFLSQELIDYFKTNK